MQSMHMESWFFTQGDGPLVLEANENNEPYRPYREVEHNRDPIDPRRLCRAAAAT